MTRAHVLRAFKQAGFPLRCDGSGRYRYDSSVIDIAYDPDMGIRVWARSRNRTYFESPAQAIHWIKARLAVQCVVDNEFCLRDPGKPGASLELIVGGAA